MSGYFIDSHLLFGDLRKGSVLARGYCLRLPDLSSSDDEWHTNLEQDTRVMLGSLQRDERFQLEFYTGNDFAAPLDRFETQTKPDAPALCRRTRAELVERFRGRMRDETLIRTNARVYLSSKIQPLDSGGGRTARGFEDVFKVVVRSFQQREQLFRMLLRRYGGDVEGLDNRGHYADLLRFWSPGQARQPLPDTIDWLSPINDLVRFGEFAPRRATDHGLFCDGFYFGVTVYKTMPSITSAFTMAPFCNLAIPGLRVVVNAEPLSVEEELRVRKERYQQLYSNTVTRPGETPDFESVIGVQDELDRGKLLMTNELLPFRTRVIVIATDRDRDKLDEKIEAIRAAVGKTGAESYRPALATSTLAFLNCASPGFGPWVRYPDYRHKMRDAVNVVNMMPLAATPAADLDQADVLFDGERNNLVGYRMFIGAQPANMLCCGAYGSGKSALIQTTMAQSAHLFRYMVVIDNGRSYGDTCRRLDPGCRTISVSSNSRHTFNLFDLNGLPLHSQKIANATGLAFLLCGSSDDEQRDRIAQALLSETIEEIYRARFEKWRNDCPESYYDLRREALVLARFHNAKMRNEHFVDAFLAARALRKHDPEALIEYEDDLAESAIIAMGPSELELLVRQLAFSKFTPDMFPTLFDLQDELHAMANRGKRNKELCSLLATLLRAWLREGRYGVMVDGASNVDLGSIDIGHDDPLKVVHFELGDMTEAEVHLKAVAGFLITNQVRNHIQGMPRGVRKQIVIEEMTSFLRVPGGNEIVVDLYERTRKYSCQVVSVMQQYSSLLKATPEVANAMITNSMNLLLLRNPNRKDLDAMCDYVFIPEVIKDKITSFPVPDDLKGRDDAHAGFAWGQLSTAEPRYTVGMNFLNDELLKLTSSSGDEFDQKRKEEIEANNEEKPGDTHDRAA
jgi:hypothetical protein